jgi:reactive intermediate/imine deaminase
MKIINTKNAPAPVGPYNQAILTSGELLFVSGQIPLDPSTGEIVGPENIGEQTIQVMKNLEAILNSAGLDWHNVVKTNVFLTDLNNFTAMNQIYAQYFQAETSPARACVQVSRLPKDVLVEIDCIAVKF